MKPSFVVLIVFFFACASSENDCVEVESFVENWWQVTGPILQNECYFFTEDGFVLEKDEQDYVKIVSTWSTEDEECLTHISSPIGDISSIERKNECLTGTHEGVTIEVCECY